MALGESSWLDEVKNSESDRTCVEELALSTPFSKGCKAHYDAISDCSAQGDLKLEIVWINVIRMVLLHVAFVTGLYYMLSGRVMLPTVLFGKKYIFLNSQTKFWMEF